MDTANKAGSEMNTVTNSETREDVLARLHEAYTARNPESLAQHHRACEVMPGGNTRSALFYPPFPLTMERVRAAISGTWTAMNM